jgi:hypothetical protein
MGELNDVDAKFGNWNENIPVFFFSFGFISRETRVNTTERTGSARSFPGAKNELALTTRLQARFSYFRSANPLHYILRMLILD